MNVNEILHSNSALLKKEDIGKARPKVVISGTELTEFDGEKKLVLKFQGKDKGLALNKTNLQILAAAFGAESDHWPGQMIEIWVDPYVTYAGRVVGGIKVTPQQSAPPPPPPVPRAPVMADPQSPPPFDDDIPF